MALDKHSCDRINNNFHTLYCINVLLTDYFAVLMLGEKYALKRTYFIVASGYRSGRGVRKHQRLKGLGKRVPTQQCRAGIVI